jgi:DNA polymerase-3 subunit gamma/tau
LPQNTSNEKPALVENAETPKEITPIKKSTLKIPTLNSFLKGETKQETQERVTEKKQNQPFTPEQLKEVWKQFAETRKMFQAEYHLFSQEIEIRNSNQVIVHLHNPVQETLLNTIKSDALTFLRDGLSNNTILLSGEFTEIADDKKVLYTNREKLDHLVQKNPKLKELKERLGLDTDF